MSTPHKCPVCGGNGLVSNGYYSQTTGIYSTSSTTPETCISCNELGIVWENYKVVEYSPPRYDDIYHEGIRWLDENG